jgi:hypothetical protein
MNKVVAISFYYIYGLLFGLIFYGKGTDFENYRYLYENNIGYGDRDIVYHWFTMIFASMGVSFSNYFIFYNAFILTLVSRICMHIAYPRIFFLVYLAGFFLYFHFNAMRQGLATIFFIWLISTLKGQSFMSRAMHVITIGVHASVSALVMSQIMEKNSKRYFLMLGLAAFISVGYLYSISNPEINIIYAAYFINEGIISEDKIFWALIFKACVVVYFCYIYPDIKFIGAIVVTLILLTHFLSLAFSRIIDPFFLLFLFRLFEVNRKFTMRSILLIILLIAVSSLSTINIALKDCESLDAGWCFNG